MNKEKSGEPSPNAFGELVRSFREMRHWSRGELAEKWGYTREYVSMIERGERKLDKYEQVYSLADVLGIPMERLVAVGKVKPMRRARGEEGTEGDEILLQALLEPVLVSTKLSWLLWLADGHRVPIAQHLASLTIPLEEACVKYRGQFLRPAQNILAWDRDMRGQMAFDQLKLTEANGHFQEVLDLGEELGDATLIALAQIHRADVLRKRGWRETALRMLSALYPTVERSEECLRGVYYQILARVHAQEGNETFFLDAIDMAEEIARGVEESVDTLYHQFHVREVVQERARGLTVLGKPEEALAIYAEVDKMRGFRPIRARGGYVLLKAQAYAYSGDMETGIDLALQGLKLARSYGSPRHISRAQEMYDRLMGTDLGKHARMKELKEVLIRKL